MITIIFGLFLGCLDLSENDVLSRLFYDQKSHFQKGKNDITNHQQNGIWVKALRAYNSYREQETKGNQKLQND